MSRLHLSALLCLLAVVGSACVPQPPESTEPDPDACDSEIQLVCDGNAVAKRDSCTGDLSDHDECPAACAAGACVDCAPNAGTICDGDDVVTIDSCGAIEESIESCANGCSGGACIDPSCTPDAATVCIDDAVYAEDSCGNVGDFALLCENGCQDGACVGCTPEAFLGCVDGDIRHFDSCGVVGDVQTDCDEACESTPNGVQCVDAAQCTPGDGFTAACFEGDFYSVDTCGNVETDRLLVECPNGCGPNDCLPCQPIPQGLTCDGNNVHELLGGCDTAPEAGDLVEECPERCAQGTCVNASNCFEGVACDGNTVIAVDTCSGPGDVIETCEGTCTDGRCDPVEGGEIQCLANGFSIRLTGGSFGNDGIQCGGCFDLDEACDDRFECLTICGPEVLECDANSRLSIPGSYIFGSCLVDDGQPSYANLCSLVDCGDAMGAEPEPQPEPTPEPTPEPSAEPSTEPPADCAVNGVSVEIPGPGGDGTLECGGCFGFDNFCDDAVACAEACTSKLTCNGGEVWFDSDFRVGSCSDASGDLAAMCEVVCAN